MLTDRVQPLNFRDSICGKILFMLVDIVEKIDSAFGGAAELLGCTSVVFIEGFA